MKKVIVIVLVLVFLLISVIVSFKSGTLDVNALGKDQAQAATATPQPGSTPVKAGGQVVAEAKVVPIRSASLSMAANGIAAEVAVAEGARVGAGDVLVRLSNARQKAAVAQAVAEVQRRQANLDELRAGSRSQELDQARASLAAAQAQLAKVKEPAKAEDLAAAQAELAAAQAEMKDLKDGATLDDKTVAAADLRKAENALRLAQTAYDKVKWDDGIGARPESVTLQSATVDHERALAAYNQAVGPAKAKDIAGAQSRVSAAQAKLTQLKRGATPAEIDSATAEVNRTQAQLALLEAGQRPESIAASEADLAAAKALLAQAASDLADTELRAPFAGEVSAVNVRVGEQVAGGTPVVQLADTSTWQVETKDLTELQIVRVKEGDPVEVTVDALPDLVLNGRVARIKPLGDNRQGDIVYDVLVDLDQQDPRLRWNMTTAVTVKGE
jgi:HlyD family secretion protein